MIRVFFLIRSLNVGGSERQLIELVKGLDKSRFAVTVATFYDGGTLRPELEAVPGVRVLSLRKKSRWAVLPFLLRLIHALGRTKPHILHGYKYGANEMVLCVARLCGAKTVTGLRASITDFASYDRFSALNFHVGAWLSRFADLIIVNSQAGKQHHIAHGYRGERMMVIPNGIDTEHFQPDSEARERMRRLWNIKSEQLLIGLVGRLDPMKDHATFLRAAALLSAERPDIQFVCVGDGAPDYKQELQTMAQELKLEECLLWAGACTDMPAVYNALDVVVSSSRGEGFSNAIGEAMACGVPCVVTDVGDSAVVVDNADQVVPPQPPPALSTALSRMLVLSGDARVALGLAGRHRIVQEYSLRQLILKTEAALTGLMR